MTVRMYFRDFDSCRSRASGSVRRGENGGRKKQILARLPHRRGVCGASKPLRSDDTMVHQADMITLGTRASGGGSGGNSAWGSVWYQ